MQDDLRKRYGARLKLLVSGFDLMTQQKLSETIGYSDRTIRSWYDSMPLSRVREVSSKLGLAEAYFNVSDEKLQRTGITPYLGALPRLKHSQKHITLEGTTTLALTRFISANKEALASTSVIIETHGAQPSTYNVNGAALSAHADGYIRSIAHHGSGAPDFIGGSNAVVEDHRLARITFKSLPEELIAFEGSSMPCRTDKEIASEGVALPATLLSWRMPAEALHYIARLPNAASFLLLTTILDENWTRFDICELAFDALKKFWPHFSLHRADRLKAEALITKFLKDHAGTAEAQAAAAYAIEALPFCTQSDLYARMRTHKLIDNIRHHRKHFVKLSWEAEFAARVAQDYLPFVTNPDAFEIPFDTVG